MDWSKVLQRIFLKTGAWFCSLTENLPRQKLLLAMEIKRKNTNVLISIVVVILSFTTSKLCAACSSSSSTLSREISIGVVLDMGSVTGKTIHRCITMASSEFYASHIHFKTRIVLHTRDSKGDPTHAISAALDLLENVKVQAIIGPETSLETKFLALLCGKAKVPMLSFSSVLSGIYPFLVQIKQDESSQFKGIASILQSYKWRSVIIIYEDNDDGREALPCLIESLQVADVHIASKSSISPLSSDDQINNDLHKLKTLQATIYIVHMSPSLSSRLFLSAKRIGLMKEGYAWIVTDKTMNQFSSIDDEVIESSQGLLGMKAYIPSSSKLRGFKSRWRMVVYAEDPLMEAREMDVLGIWAYDTVWALANSTERVWIETLNAGNQGSLDVARVANCDSGTRLLYEILGSKFTGLSGEFQFFDGKLHSETFLIVNIIGKGERRVGFWNPKHGINKELPPSFRGRSLSSSTTTKTGLEAVLWPGVSATAPTGGRKLRIAVVNASGFPELTKVHYDPETNTSSFTGYCVDVFIAAINSLDYQVPYVFENWENLGTYNDLIDQIYHQKYDGAVGDITIRTNRSMYVDFTLPFTELGTGTVARRGNSDIWVFLKPLRANLWLTSAAFFVLMGLVVWTIEHPTNEEFQGSVAYQIGTILWFGFSTLVYAHREKLTSNLSRFVVIIWLFVVLILTSSYTATLSSMLTVRQIQLVTARNYVGIQYGSFLGGLLVASNLNFTGLHPYTSPEDYASALSGGSKSRGVTVIVDELPYIKIFLAKYGKDYAMVASQSNTAGWGFVFQKGLPLVSDMSQAIVKLREEGKLEMMEKKWFKSQSSFMPENATSTPNILNLDSFGGLFVVSFLSCVSVLFIRFTFMLFKKFGLKNFIKLLDGGKLALMFRFLVSRRGNAIC
ncbi:glutamate receptor 1.2-like [Coffea arabica]|uniref:Glutamate receptor n=1 Tax=Coffea arabica TaxID=13443 RepID=A0A6P6W2E8_COFAR